MNKHILIIFTSFLILINACASNILDIDLNEMDLEGKSTIEISVCNNKSDEDVHYHAIEVEKRINGKWTAIQLAQCSCYDFCDKFVFTKLMTGQCQDYTIYVKNIDCEVDNTGEYRFTTSGTVGEYKGSFTSKYLGISEPFILE